MPVQARFVPAQRLPRQLLRGGKALGLQRVQGALRRGQREQQRLLVVRLQILRKLQAAGPVAAAVARAQPLGASGGFLFLFIREQPRGLDAEYSSVPTDGEARSFSSCESILRVMRSPTTCA